MSEVRFNGVVQWFNRKRGYGFIKVVSDGEHCDKEHFCHYTNIKTNNYRTLYPGEYVSFNIVNNDESKEVCNNITGINGGPLLIDNETHVYKIYPKKTTENVTSDNLNSDLNNNVN
tara:strand:+ start:177 stop:524 length:348 start_codon:yes stop_codon:yes gene_type:complete